MKQHVTNPGHRATHVVGPARLPKSLEHLREATLMCQVVLSFNLLCAYCMRNEVPSFCTSAPHLQTGDSIRSPCTGRMP